MDGMRDRCRQCSDWKFVDYRLKHYIRRPKRRDKTGHDQSALTGIASNAEKHWNEGYQSPITLIHWAMGKGCQNARHDTGGDDDRWRRAICGHKSNRSSSLPSPGWA